MPAVFNLSWDNSGLIPSGNVTGQLASYRQKSIGGAFIYDGFTPANPVMVPTNTTQSPSLDYNVIYQFKLETTCTINGNTLNDNGIVEQMQFNCLETASQVIRDTSANFVFDVTGLDINAIRFQVKVADVVIVPLTTVNKIGNTITLVISGLDQDQSFSLEIEFKSVVNGNTVYSSDIQYLGTPCILLFDTLVTASCPAPESLTVLANPSI